jgi:hypothetical protein
MPRSAREALSCAAVMMVDQPLVLLPGSTVSFRPCVLDNKFDYSCLEPHNTCLKHLETVQMAGLMAREITLAEWPPKWTTPLDLEGGSAKPLGSILDRHLVLRYR